MTVPAMPEWVPLASFVVEIQGRDGTSALRTLAHHVEGDESAAWPGVDADSAAAWIRERAPRPEPATASASRSGAAGETVAAAAPRPGVQIGAIRLADPAAPPAGVLGKTSTGWLAGDEPFGVTVHLDVADPAPVPRCTVHLRAEDLATGVWTDLGDAVPVTGPHGASATVVGCRLPEGLYRLTVLASEGARERLVAHQAALLRVG